MSFDRTGLTLPTAGRPKSNTASAGGSAAGWSAPRAILVPKEPAAAAESPRSTNDRRVSRDILHLRRKVLRPADCTANELHRNKWSDSP